MQGKWRVGQDSAVLVSCIGAAEASPVRCAAVSRVLRAVTAVTFQNGRGSVPQEESGAAAGKLLEGIASGVSLVSEPGDSRPGSTGAWRRLPGMVASCFAQVCGSSLHKASAVLTVTLSPETPSLSKTAAQAISYVQQQELLVEQLHAVMRSQAAAQVSTAPAPCKSASLLRYMDAVLLDPPHEWVFSFA